MISLLILLLALAGWLMLQPRITLPVQLSVPSGKIPVPDPALILFSSNPAPSKPHTGAGSSETDPDEERKVAQALLKIGSELPRESDLEVTIRRALTIVRQYLQAERGYLFMVQGGEDMLLLRAADGSGRPVPAGGQSSNYPRDRGMLGWMLQYTKPLIIDDLSEDERWQQAPELNSIRRSAIGAPLVINQEALGVLLFTSREVGAFQSDQLLVVTAAASQLANALYNSELFQLIREQATRQGGMIREKRIEASKSNAILESIAEGVLVTDENNQVVMINAAAERILDLNRGSILGGPISNFIGIYGEVGDRWQRAVQGWSEPEHELQEPVEPLEARLTLEDDRIISFSLAPVVFEDRYMGTVSTFRDITREVEVDRLKSEFVATVSHELRTPMTSVKGYVEMLLMEAVGDVNDQQRRFLKVIKNNIDRLGSLVNDLLDISRIEAGRVSLDLEPLDLSAILEETTELFKRRTRLESKPMSIELVLPEELPPVQADRDRLRQIIANLMENSFNYTPIDGHIKLSAELEENLVAIEVQDDGIGISAADQSRVFERFFRGDQALDMAVAGTGLGLSIVRQLVEMHGGNISLQSSGVPGEGTCFRFTLPIAGQQESNGSNQ